MTEGSVSFYPEGAKLFWHFSRQKFVNHMHRTSELHWVNYDEDNDDDDYQGKNEVSK